VPTYQYACTACGARSEVVQKFTDDPLTVCEVCSGRLRKIFSPVGIVFKGPGFYRTDSRAPAKEPAAASNGSGAAAKASGDSASGESSAKKPSGDGSSANGSSSGSSSGSGSSASSDSSSNKVA
jgi:putative FmdB family regulatory protein